MEHFDLFEEYMDNQLSPGEKDRFEQRLKDDPLFLQEFEEYRLLQSDMQLWQQTEGGRMQLKKTIEQITSKSEDKSKVRSMGRYLWRAAAVFILAVALWWLFVPASSKSNSELFAQYSPGENISISRGAENDSLWGKVSAYFYDKKYGEAIPVLQQIIKTGKDTAQESTALLGYCFMKTNNDRAAENILIHTVFEQKKIVTKANWYKALLYLKAGPRDSCIATLTRLLSSDGAYAVKAAALLKEKIH